MFKYLLIPCLVLCYLRPDVSSAVAIACISAIIILEQYAAMLRLKQDEELDARLKRIESKLENQSVAIGMR